MNISLEQLQLLPAELSLLMMRAAQQQVRALQSQSTSASGHFPGNCLVKGRDPLHYLRQMAG